MAGKETMRVVGIDTSAETGSVALVEGESLVAEVTLAMERTHSERLLPALDAAMQLVGWSGETVELVAVAIGPGPFTALRIGVTAAKSLAYGWGAPAVGIPTFDAIAHRYRYAHRNLAILFDARKAQVFAAYYRHRPWDGGDDLGTLERVGDFRCDTVDALLDGIETPTLFLGNGAAAYRATIRTRLGDLADFAEAEAAVPHAASVAFLGRRRFARNPSTPADVHVLAPLYIRRPEAEVKRERAAST